MCCGGTSHVISGSVPPSQHAKPKYFFPPALCISAMKINGHAAVQHGHQKCHQPDVRNSAPENISYYFYKNDHKQKHARYLPNFCHHPFWCISRRMTVSCTCKGLLRGMQGMRMHAPSQGERSWFLAIVIEHDGQPTCCTSRTSSLDLTGVQ